MKIANADILLSDQHKKGFMVHRIVLSILFVSGFARKITSKCHPTVKYFNFAAHTFISQIDKS